MVSGEVQNDGDIKAMTISTKWTLINFILSIIGSVTGHFTNAAVNSDYTYDNAFLYIPLIVFLPTFVPASISLVILLFSEKLCSTCCKVNLPIVYKTGVDINDFSHIIDLQTGQDYGKNEDEEINATETEAKTHQLESIASSVCETNSETISNNEAAN